MKRTVAVMLMCAGMGSCDPRLPSSPDLFVDFGVIDASTTPLSPRGKSFMNGVYDVVQGTGELGTTVVGKWVDNRWCMYSQHDVVFSVCGGGSVGSSIILRGYIRIVRSGSGTRVGLSISTDEGGRELTLGDTVSAVRIQGTTEDGTTIDLRRAGNRSTAPLDIVAHRGGGRNSDRLGISENSVEMIRYAGYLGATGVEIDVKRTRDNQLIVFHDDTFSPRTVQGAYLLGKVEEYDLSQIRSLGKLINGEQIPTLSDALTAVIEDTQLSLVWLDIKDPGEVPQVVQIQIKMLQYAATRGRDTLSILLGIPSQEVLDAYFPFRDSSDALCELEPANVISLPRCRVWAPVWTRNITAGEIAGVRVPDALGRRRKVITWTVDLRENIGDYLNLGVDGILSNYPTLVAAIHDSK